MTSTTTTLVILTISGLVGYNLVMLHVDQSALISRVIESAIRSSPWVPLIIGLLVGHWMPK